MVLPYHRSIDEARERKPQTGEPIGTTKRGIGPCYCDKAARVGLRMGDLVDPSFAQTLNDHIVANNKILGALGAPRRSMPGPCWPTTKRRQITCALTSVTPSWR